MFIKTFDNYRRSSPYANFITVNFISAIFQNLPENSWSMVRFLMKQTLLINAENFLTKVYKVQVIGTMFIVVC